MNAAERRWAPVGIVGAGPVGMVLALRLASFGVPSVVLEAEPALRKQGSKACLIQGDVLDVLDKFGCAAQLADEGVTWHVGHTYVKGEEIRRTEYPRPIGYGPFVNISQYRIEQVLLAALEAEPEIELLWSQRVVAVAQDDDGVTVDVEGGGRHHFRYLVACDGMRSTVRELVGVEWTGYSHKDRFLITDIKAALPFVKERHFHYDPPFNPGRQTIMHPQPDGVWRIDWQLAPDADIDEERHTGALDRRIRAVIGDVPYEIDWLSTYRFNQRVVERLKVGWIFFAGDAAHAMPPYGSRGMNSGIQDADNLAWKLALVLHRQAKETLLDTYHVERLAAAKENLAVAEATIKFMAPPSEFRRFLRDVLLALVRPVRSLRRHVNSGRMAEPFVYDNSPIVEPRGSNPVVGMFAPDGLVRHAGATVRLRTFLGAGFVGLFFGAHAAATARLAMQAAAPSGGVPARLVLVLPSGKDCAGVTGTGDPPIVVVSDVDDGLRARYGAGDGSWFVVRPDGHVAAVREAARAGEFVGVVRACADAFDTPVRREHAVDSA
jgi:2-polyprenyl-6-methoxyphenol hydroxylase-like FAD-dependent oxidoreductase